MKQTIIVSSLVASIVWLAASAILIELILPSVVEAQATQMRAQAYLLVDSDGADRGALEYSTNPQGQPISTLRLTQNGALRVRMETGRNGPEAAALTLRDQMEQIRIRLGLATSAGGGVGDVDAVDIFDADQHVRIHIGVDGTGSPFIQLLDAEGNISWGAP
jgi:hypothetical protein